MKDSTVKRGLFATFYWGINTFLHVVSIVIRHCTIVVLHPLTQIMSILTSVSELYFNPINLSWLIGDRWFLWVPRKFFGGVVVNVLASCVVDCVSDRMQVNVKPQFMKSEFEPGNSKELDQWLVDSGVRVCPGGAIGLPVDGRLKRSIISVDVVRKYKSTSLSSHQMSLFCQWYSWHLVGVKNIPIHAIGYTQCVRFSLPVIPTVMLKMTNKI